MVMEKRYYAFLDVVMDVLYSIVLYNLFADFPGFGNFMVVAIFLFTTVLMINYWWFSRSVAIMPRHFMIDVYFYSLVMFIFMKLADHIGNAPMFMAWLFMLFFVDFAYCIADIIAHKPGKGWRTYLNHYLVWNCAIMIYYFIGFLTIKEFTAISVVAIIAPYAAYMAYSLRKGLMKTRLEYRE